MKITTKNTNIDLTRLTLDFFEGKITLPVFIAYENGSDEEKTFWENVFRKETRDAEDFDKIVLSVGYFFINKIFGRCCHEAKSICRAESGVRQSVAPNFSALQNLNIII